MISFCVRNSDEKLRYAEANCAVGRLDVEDRDLRLGREIAAHLVHLRADLGERSRRVVVELQPGGDGREVLLALRLDVVDAVGGGDDALERRRDEAAHEVGVRAHVDGGDGDGGVLAARVLADVQRADRLHAGDHDDEVHDDRDDRAADEEVGELHGAFSRSGVTGPPASGRARRPARACCHRHRRAVAQLEGAARHDLLARRRGPRRPRRSRRGDRRGARTSGGRPSGSCRPRPSSARSRRPSRRTARR